MGKRKHNLDVFRLQGDGVGDVSWGRAGSSESCAWHWPWQWEVLSSNYRYPTVDSVTANGEIWVGIQRRENAQNLFNLVLIFGTF